MGGHACNSGQGRKAWRSCLLGWLCVYVCVCARVHVCARACLVAMLDRGAWQPRLGFVQL